MGRMQLGWQLAKQSWRVVRADRSLLIFPVVAAIASIIVTVAFVALGAGVYSASEQEYAVIPVALIGAYALTVIAQGCAVALAACASKALDGHDTTFSDGVAAARERTGVILAWSAVMLFVGVLINVLQSVLRDTAGGLIAGIVGGLANFAWTVATFFVVPVLALEGVGPKDAISKSAQTIKARWGEGAVGTASIGLATFIIGWLPGIALVAGGVFLVDSAPALGGVLIALGAVVIIVATLLQSAISAVFRVALYRYASRGEVSSAFSEQQLAGAFRAKAGTSIA